VGQAILHIHTPFSDGTATVEEILDDADRHGEIDVVGITDHDDTRAFEWALRWKAAHPASRIQPIWGVELTIRAFKHLLLFRLEPPFPTAPPPKFLSLRQAMVAARALGAFVVVPHVDTFWIGLGRHRLAPLAERLGIDGFELLNPHHGTDQDVAALMALNCRHERRHGRPLLAVGGSDAHHLEDLYRVIVDFPGETPGDLARAFRARTALPRWGPAGPAPPLRKQLTQHTRALLFHPAEQVGRRLCRPFRWPVRLRDVDSGPAASQPPDIPSCPF
jgi:PHP domain